jgi:hypothetical protein
MFDFEDPWWLIGVCLVVVLWVMGVVIPVRLVSPAVSVSRHYADLEDDSTEDLPPPARRPSVFLPVLVFLAGLGGVALGAAKRLREPEGGTRWMWLAAACGLACFWALILVLMTLRMAGQAG